MRKDKTSQPPRVAPSEVAMVHTIRILSSFNR